MPAQAKPNEIQLNRVYDAPVKTVWDAWNDPAQAAQWWGPRGFTLTSHSKDLRVGGTWVYTMHGPDGTDYPNKTTYLELEPYKKLVYDHGATADTPPMFRVTVVFTEVDGKTHMDMIMALPTAEAAQKTRGFIKKVGGDSTWDRFSEYLEKNASGKDVFVINRAFDVPIDDMYELWTNPEHVSKWLAPTGSEMAFIRADIREGGRSFYWMSMGQGKMFGRCDYRKLKKPDTIIYTQEFCDEQENISRHPMAPTWPATMLTTIHLTAESDTRTRVTITWEPFGETTHEELQTFIHARAGMTQGWTGSLDKLESYAAARA